MNAGALGSRAIVVRRTRNLVHRFNWQTVFLIAEPKYDELLVGHGVLIHGAFRRIAPVVLIRNQAAHQLGSKQSIRRKHCDQAPAIIEAANRGDLGVAGAAGKQGGRRVDQARVDVKDVPSAVCDHADTAAANRQHHDPAAFLTMSVIWQPQQRTQRHQRQQPVPQCDNSRTAVSERAKSDTCSGN